MKFEDFSWEDIVMEAPEDENLEGDDDLGPTDYTETEDMDIEEGEPPAEEPTEGEETEDMGEEPAEGDDELGSPDDMSGEGEEGLNEEEDTEQTDNEETESENTTDIQNKNLINDFIELYRRINEIINQVRTDCKSNVRYNSNVTTVRKNLDKLKDVTYDYITNKFSEQSYVSNLYQFNLIIQALNVNIDLFASVLATDKAVKNKDKKDKKGKK
jgi:hypothetical protein